MVRYAIVRYTKEVICFVDGEKEAKTIAYICAKNDNDDNEV